MYEFYRRHGPAISTVIVNLSTLAAGIAIAWSSHTVADLMEPIVDPKKNPLGRSISIIEGSLIASFMTVGASLGPFPAAIQARHFGRKPALLSGTIFFLFAFTAFLCAREVWHICLGRFFQGLGVAYVTTVATIYVGEIATTKDRGALGSLLQVFLCLGILLMNSISNYLDYIIVNMVCMIFPLVSGILFLFVRESPYYYISIGDMDKATETMMFFRNKEDPEAVADELQEIQRIIRQRDEDSFNVVGKLFHQRGNRRALMVCLGLFFFQQFSGINAILFYTKAIMMRSNVNDVNMGIILFSLMMFLSAVLVPFLSLCGCRRKWMLSLSAIGMAIANSGLGAYFKMVQSEHSDMENFNWVPLTMLLMYPFFFSIGFGPLPWVILGEMLNDSIKFIVAPLASSLCWALAFLISVLFPVFDVWFGASASFFTFGALCMVALLFTNTMVLETKGLTLYEIQRLLNNWGIEYQ